MTGGNQTKLATVIVGTPLGQAIRAAHQRGAVIAGTSAGASICSEHMVSFGSGGSTPKFRVGQVSQGLGVLTGVIVDQHFTQRNRFGRLLALVAANPGQLGVGIDEDTAAIVSADGRLEVKGRGVVTIIDGADVITTAYTATGTQPLMMSGFKLHTLPRGAVFDVNARRLISAPGLPRRRRRRCRPWPTYRVTPARAPGGSPPRVRTPPPPSCAGVRRRPERARWRFSVAPALVGVPRAFTRHRQVRNDLLVPAVGRVLTRKAHDDLVPRPAAPDHHPGDCGSTAARTTTPTSPRCTWWWTSAGWRTTPPT